MQKIKYFILGLFTLLCPLSFTSAGSIEMATFEPAGFNVSTDGQLSLSVNITDYDSSLEGVTYSYTFWGDNSYYDDNWHGCALSDGDGGVSSPDNFGYSDLGGSSDELDNGSSSITVDIPEGTTCIELSLDPASNMDVSGTYSYSISSSSGGGDDNGGGVIDDNLLTGLQGVVSNLSSTILEFIPYVVYIGLGVLGAILGFVAVKRLINLVRSKVFKTFRRK